MDDVGDTYLDGGDDGPENEELEPLPELPPDPSSVKLAPAAGAIAPDGLTITMPSGAQFPVLTPDEATFMVDRIHRYNADNRFSNISDLSDLDRLLINEMFVFRWQYWISTGADYANEEVSESSLRKNVQDFGREIRLLKDQLGVDRSSRERARGESVADYLLTLRQRARMFGIHRDEQVAKLYELGHQLLSLRIFNLNCLPDERRELGITDQDLLTWIDQVFKVEFEALDIAFRKNQAMWIREM